MSSSDPPRESTTYVPENRDRRIEAAPPNAGEASRFALIRDDLLTFLSSGTLLEIGCREGRNCLRFSELGFDCTGIDRDERAIQFARRTTDAKAVFLHANVTPSQVEVLAKYDIVVISTTLQQLLTESQFQSAEDCLKRLCHNCEVLYLDVETDPSRDTIPNGATISGEVHRLLQRIGLPVVELIGPVAAGRLLYRTSRASARQAPVVAQIKHAISRSLTAPSLFQRRNRYFRTQIWQDRLDDGQKIAIKLIDVLDERAETQVTHQHEFLIRLDSPRFPKLIMHGRLGTSYVLVSEWIAGEPLSLLAGRLTCRFNTQWLRSELDAIRTALVDAGIRHRDIHERNLTFAPGRLVLSNFDWACRSDERNVFSPPELPQPDDT